MRALAVALGLMLLAGGCAPRGFFNLRGGGQPPPVVQTYANPGVVPAVSPDCLWDSLVDVVDDYFRIAREDRVRMVGNVLTEGRIDTFPLGGATYLEPWRDDSVGSYNRWESTLQTIRRRAQLRIIPAEGGYLVEVTVLKELEDAKRPLLAANNAATFRQDIVSDSLADELIEDTAEQGWITLGRDGELEQAILAKIHHRLGNLKQ